MEKLEGSSSISRNKLQRFSFHILLNVAPAVNSDLSYFVGFYVGFWLKTFAIFLPLKQ